MAHSNPQTQILLHSPQALRIQWVVDTGELVLWWSPLAGESYDAAIRNFSSRDDHLTVFKTIVFPGLHLAAFVSCDYDPYHAVVHFTHQHVHLVPCPDTPSVLIWTEAEQAVEIESGRYDAVIEQTRHTFVISHTEPSFCFTFHALCGEGEGFLRATPRPERWRSVHARAVLSGGQTLLIGAGVEGDAHLDRSKRTVRAGRAAVLDGFSSMVREQCGHGLVALRNGPRIGQLQDLTRRCLHSMIDCSGALRASPKEIYYLIWIRDSAFCFGYQAMAGWVHRFNEWCRLLFENRLEIDEPGLPPGKVFGQLVGTVFGKLEEDGIYYALWSACMYHTQTGDDTFVTGRYRAMLIESMDWIERYIFDKDRGLFGSYFADESPTAGARDTLWDHAAGKPTSGEALCFQGVPVKRCYDIYINLLMHASWSMLASITEGELSRGYAAKAAALAEKIRVFFNGEAEGLPPYGELLLDNGKVVVAEPYAPSRSVYVWALSLPTCLSIAGIDGIRRRLLEEIMRAPGGHWINGLCAVLASLDSIACPEELLYQGIQFVCDQAFAPGRFAPMAGAMPEKCDTARGEQDVDIRPQAFAQSAWLGALSNLGVRRLARGLAVRPSKYLAAISEYVWRGKTIDFSFGDVAGIPLLYVNGQPVRHTLQIPESALSRRANSVSVGEGGGNPCLVRSTVELQQVTESPSGVEYRCTAFGDAELVFLGSETVSVTDKDGRNVPLEGWVRDALHFVTFTARGAVTVSCVVRSGPRGVDERQP